MHGRTALVDSKRRLSKDFPRTGRERCIKLTVVHGTTGQLAHAGSTLGWAASCGADSLVALESVTAWWHINSARCSIRSATAQREQQATIAALSHWLVKACLSWHTQECRWRRCSSASCIGSTTTMSLI